MGIGFAKQGEVGMGTTRPVAIPTLAFEYSKYLPN